jgi:hypothetical protein
MADEKLNGAAEPEERPKSLREIAEESYNEVDKEVDGAETPPETSDERVRDSLGRFVSKEPGEATPEGVQPQIPAEGPGTQEGQTQPPETVSSSQAPQHWSAEDRALFEEQTPEARAFLLRRHQDMERDYQSKVQASAQAIQFVDQIAPIFNDPSMQAMLYIDDQPVTPARAIAQWASFHRRAMNPDPYERATLLVELAQRMRLDPAAVFGQTATHQPDPNLPDDPAIRYFADQFGRTINDVQALRGELQQLRQQDTERQSAEAVQVSRWAIDTFADEKDQQGNPLHPHFDAVLPEIMELYRANPDRDLKEAYETAVWMKPEIRQSLLAGQRNSADQQRLNQRASQAARSNVRGRTSPVTTKDSGDEPKSLRATIASSADEVGF